MAKPWLVRTATVRAMPSAGTTWGTGGASSKLTTARSVADDWGSTVMQVQSQPLSALKPGAVEEQRLLCGASLMEHAHGNELGTAKDAIIRPAASRRCTRDMLSLYVACRCRASYSFEISAPVMRRLSQLSRAST